MSRGVTRFLIGFLTITLMVGGWLVAPRTAQAAGSAATSAAGYSARLVTLINDARAEHGLGPLRAEPGTTEVATWWAAFLARRRVLKHNPNLPAEVASHGSPNWACLAENVGDGRASSPSALFRASWPPRPAAPTSFPPASGTWVWGRCSPAVSRGT